MRRPAFLLLGLLVSLAVVQATTAQPLVSIDGRLVNGTADGGDVTAIEVTLSSFDQQATPKKVTSAAAGADGTFHFPDVDVDPSLAYFVSARYAGVDYWTEPITFEEGQPPTLELTVYETTRDPADLAVELAHTAIDVLQEERALDIVQYEVLINEGDRTYVGDAGTDGQSQIRLLSLPPGAADATIIGAPVGASLTPDGLAVIGSQPIVPGNLEVAVTYRISYLEDSQLITLPIDYPVRKFAFLLPDMGLDVESDRLSFETVTTTGDREYVRMGGADLAPGEPLTVQLQGLPEPGGGGGINSLAAIMIGFAAAAALAIPYLWWQRRRQRPAQASADSVSSREALLLELAELEERLDAGSLPEQEYLRLRAEIRGRLQAALSPHRPETGQR